jgi:hypothetical protein
VALFRQSSCMALARGLTAIGRTVHMHRGSAGEWCEMMIGRKDWSSRHVWRRHARLRS